MKTKHLFYTVALVGALAACTNDDFLESANGSQEQVGMERPAISNVTLRINGTDTRLAYDGKYHFEEGDKMSVILMDENNTGVRYGSTTNADEWNKLTWLEKYHLVDYAHTNLPFIYETDAETGVSIFNSNADNVLEGNYFMAFPYAPLDGNRQVILNIADQEQVGDAMSNEVRAHFIANNQQFVGYGRLEADEDLSQFEVSLAPVLFPYYFTIKNNTGSDVPLQITKVVLTHSELTSVLTLDPTRAYYNDPTTSPKSKGWNLETSYVKEHTDSWATEEPGDIYHFNYANFLACQPATMNDSYKEELYDHERYGSLNKIDYVYNIDGEAGDATKPWVNVAEQGGESREAGKYYWDDAIRSVVQPMREFNNPEYATGYIEVVVKDGYYEGKKPIVTKDYLEVEKDEKIRVAMMLPQFDLKGDESLKLSIYTNKGIIKDIDLSKKDNNGVVVDTQTSGILDRIDPTDNKVREMIISLDNPSINKYPSSMTINNEDDLLQLVNWMNDGAESADKNPKVCFTNDITINDELAAAIEKLNANTILSVYSAAAPGNNLRIATSAAHANILEHLDVASNVTVEVMNGGVLNMTEKSYNLAHQISSNVDAGVWWGELHIEVAKNGTLNIVSNDHYGTGEKPELNFGANVNDTEVFVRNEGTINVKDLNVLGFWIKNEGQMNVAKGTSVTFAPNCGEYGASINTIRGTITVETGGEISGSDKNNIVNQGTINNGGAVYNILNLGNGNGKKPGLINITSIEAVTNLSENTGVVDYHEFLTGVRLNNTYDGMENSGEYIYTGVAGAAGLVNDETKDNDGYDEDLAGINLSELDKAYVTIANITGGDLVADQSGVTTLKVLTLKDGVLVKPYESRDEKTGVLKEFKRDFSFKVADNDYKGGRIIFEAGSGVENIAFWNLQADAESSKYKAVLFKGTSSKNVTFYAGKTKNEKGDPITNAHRTTSFNAPENKYATLWFENVNVEVTLNSTVKANAMEAVDLKSSTIYNDGIIKLSTPAYDDKYIQIKGDKPERL